MTISKKRLQEIQAIRDEDIDYSDIPELGDDFWTRAELKLPQGKERITIRLDRDVLDWLRAQGRGYQSRINAILRQHMNAQRQANNEVERQAD